MPESQQSQLEVAERSVVSVIHQIDEIVAGVRAVLNLHRVPPRPHSVCPECLHIAPCPTREALEALPLPKGRPI